jgi:hypothetical protein
MGSIIRLLLVDEASIILLFRIFKFGFIHPNVNGKVTGIIIGIWRFEAQLIFGFWNKEKQEAMYHA